MEASGIMTKLLVSVRSAAEADIANSGGADLIDVKEPNRGSLGVPDRSTVDEIVRHFGGRIPLSVALGELLSPGATSAGQVLGVQYAKFGLSGCARRADWMSCWQRAVAQLPAGVQSVAVAYADWATAGAPDPWSVLAHALAARCGAVLVDTFDKSRGALTDQLALDPLGRWIAAARKHGMTSVVAGGLGLAEITRVLPLGPDYVAVRGAACIGDRTGGIDAGRVRELAALVHAAPITSSLGRE